MRRSLERWRLFSVLLVFPVLATLLLPTLASSAGAEGVSLADLVRNDGRIESSNGALKFDDFSASLQGLPRSELSRFLVVPLVDGFRIQVNSDSFLPADTRLVLRYEAESEDEFSHSSHGGGHGWSGDGHHRLEQPLRSMSLGLVGTSFLSYSGEMKARGDDDDDEGHHFHDHDGDRVIGRLHASTRPPPGPFAATDLDRPSRELDIVAIFLGLGGPDAPAGNSPHPGAAVPGAEMRFSFQAIPEPSSVVLVSLGLFGLSIVAKRGPRGG